MVPVGGPRQQIILALLLAAEGRIVPVDALITALWNDRPPATARGQVHTCVSGLRRGLASRSATVIVTQAPGYALRLDASDSSDLHQFDALVEEGRLAGALEDPATAAEHLRAALELWRGEPFGGLGRRSAPLEDIAAALWERRAIVLNTLVECEFVLGHHADTINELRREVDRNPLAERTRAQLMMAFYGAGRQAEALREYQLARKVLVDELGVEPGAELREIERRVLTGVPVPTGPPSIPVPATTPAQPDGAPSVPVPDPAEAPTPVSSPSVPRHLPPPVADFIARKAELADVHAWLTGEPPSAVGAAACPAPVAVVIGGAGVGKSALVIHSAWRLASRFPDGQLYADLRDSTPGALAELPRRFLAALGVPAEKMPEHADERLALYRQMLAGRRLLIVLDDVDLEEQIRPLLPGAGACATLVTSRRRLAGIPGALTVELKPFRPSDSVMLLESVLRDGRVRADTAGAERLAELCDNLPLALRIAAARLTAWPHWSLRRMADRLAAGSLLDELHHGGLAVRDSVLLTYRLLEPAARQLFRMLGLLEAPDFREWIATPLCGGSGGHPEDAMAVLVELHLLQVTMVDGTSRFAMHSLVRAVARERLAAEESPAERAAALDRLFRASLTLLDVVDPGVDGGRLGSVRGDTERYPMPQRHLAEVSEDPLAWLAEEIPFLLSAIVQSAALELPGVVWELALGAVVGLEAGGSHDTWWETHTAARLVVESQGDQLGLAAIDHSLGVLATQAEDLGLAETHLAAGAAGFARLRHAQGSALVQADRAFVSLLRGEPDRVGPLAEQALGWFRDAGDAAGQAQVLRTLARRDIIIGDRDAAVARLQCAADLCLDFRDKGKGAEIARELGAARLTCRSSNDTDVFRPGRRAVPEE